MINLEMEKDSNEKKKHIEFISIGQEASCAIFLRAERTNKTSSFFADK